MNQAIPLLIDLSTCAKEPIRTPGSIQPHGFLLTLSESLEVLQASANLASWTGFAVEDVLGKPLATLIGAETLQRWVRGRSTWAPSRLSPAAVSTCSDTAGTS
jgi:chemotaxis family two-component system sensor kinase Cph1